MGKQKISDEQLMKLIWDNQMLLTAEAPLNLYVGNVYGLLKEACNTDFHYKSGVSQHRARIDKAIITELSRPQLLKRIKNLVNDGLVSSPYGKDEMLTIFIDSDRALEAFMYAHKYWDSQGVPSGFDEDKKKMRTTPLPDHDNQVKKISGELLDKFPYRLTT